MKNKPTVVRMFPSPKPGRKPWKVMDSTSESGLTNSTKRGRPSSNGPPHSSRIESSLESLCYFGWFLGLYPRYPTKLESFKIRSKSFFLHASYATIFLIIFNFVKSAMLLQVFATNFDSHADKLAIIVREMASATSDFFIRLGLLIRAENAVRLVKSIQDYNLQYSRLSTSKGKHKGMKYLSICALNSVYVFWIMGVTYRRLNLSSKSVSGILETKVTFIPNYSDYNEGNMNILDTASFISSVISSYYLSLLIILVAHILLELLDDFYEKLYENIHGEGKTLIEQTTPYSSLPRSQSDLSLFFLKENGQDSTLRSEKNENQTHYFHETPPSIVTHAQFTELSRIFYHFNRTIGVSLVASVFADILMIITIIYTLFVNSASTGTHSNSAASCSAADASGCTFSYANLLILLSEAEYECRIFITAAIGSYLTFKITLVKTKLQELTYSFEGFSEAVFCTRAGSILKRFLQWQWVLRGMDIFNVNLRLLPSVIATVTTYVIVLLQVRMSENPYRGQIEGITNHT